MDDKFVPIFEPLDLPNDIGIVSYEPTFIFKQTLMDGNSIQFAVKFTGNSFVSYLVDVNFIITEERIFTTSEYSGNNLNDYIWILSNCSYEYRDLMGEIITRIGSIKDTTNLNRLNLILRDFSMPTVEDDGSSTD